MYPAFFVQNRREPLKRTEKTGFQKKQTEPMGDVQIQEFLDMIAPAVIKFETESTLSAAIPIAVCGH